MDSFDSASLLAFRDLSLFDSFYIFFSRINKTILSGVGGSLYWCFGIVYLDDNMGKANSPFMLR